MKTRGHSIIFYAGHLLLWCSLVFPCAAWPLEKAFLSTQDEKSLLALSRATLSLYLNRQEVPLVQQQELTERLRKKCGVFVTLKEKKNGELRGCIGYMADYKPLAEATVDCTIYAATRDQRFKPMRAGEDSTVDIEISVLTPARKITTIEEIKVGEHGLVLTQGRKSGVLLPQVPLEQGWSRDDFLKAICRKADLPDNAWEQGAELSVFTAQVFGENHKKK